MFYYHSNNIFSINSSEKRVNFEPVNQQNKLSSRKQHHPAQHNPVHSLSVPDTWKSSPQRDLGSLRAHTNLVSALPHHIPRAEAAPAQPGGFLKIL